MPIQQTPKLPGEHAAHAAILAQCTNHTHDHHIISGYHLWQSEPVATSRHCNEGASNPQPFGYGSYALTNCAITVRQYMAVTHTYCQGMEVINKLYTSTVCMGFHFYKNWYVSM